ncbi:hypothetical protein [Streptomyces sp. NPDC019539]|uniref:hypothetical protein n=1 Tax=Streptomyces sp. NPDC019539 TaxID=3365063 RepID=UPI0037B299AF
MDNYHYPCDVDAILSDKMNPTALAELEASTKEGLGQVIGFYTLSGYQQDDIIAFLNEQLGSTDINQADARQIAEVVENLVESLQQQFEATAFDQSGHEEVSGLEEIYAELGNAAGEDAAETFNHLMVDLPAATVRIVWEEVRNEIPRDMKRNPASWTGDVDIREASFYALWGALQGFLEAGETEGFPIPTAQQ